MRPESLRLGAEALAGAFAGLLLGLGAACEESPASSRDAEAGVDADAQAPVTDARVEPDAAPVDASVPPVGVPHDFCGEAFFQLPIGGPYEYVMGHSLWEDRLVYTRGPRGITQWDVYYLNLTDCLEYQLTQGYRASDSYVLGNEILWSDNKDRRDEPDYHCKDLYRYDLETWTSEQLTDHPLCEWEPKTNGRYVTYRRNTTNDSSGPTELLLWDRQEGTELQLSEPGMSAGYYDITDRYAVWSCYTQYAESLGKDVFYYDLVTGEETHVPNSANYYCYDVRLWGEYLTYVCSEYWHESWYHLFLHHIPTGEEIELDGAGKDTRLMAGVIHEHLVMWNTTKYMDEVVPFEVNSDIQIYDIQTGMGRRVTTAESRLAVWLISFPYVFMIKPLGDHAYDYYIANLVSLGVADATGFVIPGDPVLDPPP